MFQRMEVIGNVGQAESKDWGDGRKSINFSLATSRRGRDGEDETTWFSCQLSGDAAKMERAERYIYKGRLLFVEGIMTRKEKPDGDGYWWNLRAWKAIPMGKPAVARDIPEDDVPF